MPSVGRLLLTLLLSFLVTFGLASALSPGQWHQHWQQPHREGEVAAAAAAAAAAATQDGEVRKADELVSFSSLLEAVSSESLHELLHEFFPDRFKHGVWESEQSAIQAVHRADAALATSIVQLARRDNGTTTGPSNSPTTPPSGDTTASSPPAGETNTSGSTTGGSNPPQTTPTNNNPAPTSSNNPSPNRPGTTGTTLTTDKTPTPTTQSLKPVTSTYTSTMENGGVVIVTATSFVPADPSQTSPSTTRSAPSLQNAAPSQHFHFAIMQGLLGAAIGTMLLI